MASSSDATMQPAEKRGGEDDGSDTQSQRMRLGDIKMVEIYQVSADDTVEIPTEHNPLEFRYVNYYDDDDGELLSTEAVHAGIEREMKFMEGLEVGTAVRRSELPPDTKVWGTRWCHRKKGSEVRSRFVVQQFKNAIDTEVHASTPRMESVRLIMAIALLYDLVLRIGDFSVAFMHTPMHDEPRTCVQPPPELGLGPGWVWVLNRALYGLREAAKRFQEYLKEILQSMGFQSCLAEPTPYYNKTTGVRTVIHVDDPLTAGSDEEIIKFFELLGGS